MRLARVNGVAAALAVNTSQCFSSAAATCLVHLYVSAFTFAELFSSLKQAPIKSLRQAAHSVPFRESVQQADQPSASTHTGVASLDLKDKVILSQ